MNELKIFLDRLSPLSTASWEKFSNLFTVKTLTKGEFYIREGQMAKEIGFLNSGILRAFYQSEDGIEYNKHFFIPHCFIGGYASLTSKKTNVINQQALTDCELLVANYADIEKLYPSFPDIERISRLLAEQFFIQKEQREIEIVLMDSEQRYKIFQKDFPSLEQHIPQYHIASYLGITPTQLGRIRRKIAKR
ncbi:Crp/Fnr family transcriptional regulator [Mucilaginibacter limnophilus]|uniref:Crp/Fnr family transcriptional regulator n=1 Tax=Mucilaginibacter limnophilus TaxID=1932778 RepID=A0A3S2ULR2_9SPHI|nr:Crp/Fnr family transcriptional regulator [Mucilaginibacter limnophilus]RVT97219.1 Crp/Fnr family transcriptional regulator [Mucilaginibacter limnophilus]